MAIFLYFFAGIAFLVGVPAILVLGLGLIYIACGVVYIIIGNKLRKGSRAIKELEGDDKQEIFNQNSLEVIKNLGQGAKIYAFF